MAAEPPAVTLRPERPADAPHIAELTRLAFASHPHSSHTEEFIIEALRRAGALTISLVAESRGGLAGGDLGRVAPGRSDSAGRAATNLVGHIAFSPVTVADGAPGWFGLGPMAVAPALQRRGIGSRLVDAGLLALRAHGAAGCVVLGEPSFYKRFDFRPFPGLRYAGAPPESFLALAFDGPLPRGDVRYDDAFDATA